MRYRMELSFKILISLVVIRKPRLITKLAYIINFFYGLQYSLPAYKIPADKPAQ